MSILYVDNRERHVIDTLTKLCCVNMKIEPLDVGDFAIIVGVSLRGFAPHADTCYRSPARTENLC